MARFFPGSSVRLAALLLFALTTIASSADPRGGLSFLLRVRAAELPNGGAKPLTAEEIAKVRDVLKPRVASLGVSDPVFESEGTDRLRVVLPGLSAARLAEARGQLSKLGRIEFRLVHLQSDAMVKGTVPPDPACERIEQTITKDGVAAKTFLFAQRKPALSGEQVVGVKIAEGNRGWGLTLTFDAVGARLFKDVTSKNAGAQLALVIDGVVISAPNINEPILGGTAAISGAFTFNEARDLAAVLAHPLPNPVAIEEEKILPPSSNGVTAPSL